jgi:hypothetical protein
VDVAGAVIELMENEATPSPSSAEERPEE